MAIIAPKRYSVERSISINRSLSEVFQYLKLVKNQNDWSPWKKKDPNMKQEYFGIDGEAGFVSKWEGNKDVGTGEQEIKRVVENKIIETQLRFYKPWKSQSDAFIKVEDIVNEGTKVTWSFAGINKPPSNIFFLFFNMDKTVGKDFEEGLGALKVILENK